MDQGKATSRASEMGELLLTQQKGYGFAFTDPDGTMVGWTGAAEWITGWTENEAIGNSIALIFTPEDRERQLHQHELSVAQKLGSAEDERWHLRKDGSRFWASGLCLPLAEGSGFVKIFKDATHLRSRAESLENEVRELERQLARRHDILGIVAHELRNPMSPIKTAATLLEWRDSDPEVIRLSKMITRQLETMERLVEDLVDITRVRSGKLSMDFERVELQALLVQAVESVRPAAEAKGVNIAVLVPPVLIVVEVDPVRIRQVVSNLMTNAIRFSQASGHVSVTATVDPTHLFLQVRDDGRGIGPELLPRIFDMFTQAGGTRTARGDGLGIGLAVVKEIVGSHRGTIEVRSEGIGKGSEFTARIPLRQSAEVERDQEGRLRNSVVI